ncbi:zinc finger, C3HC4 type [Oesophagostomum dentatum]|uniref:E3 ubiquitin-protein ligase n=1 Tax=Oesophagostomum dentatum TaxID=61180 RepID=A0A0B1SWL3_OESDE|nr:zinc finger, C3HC4 type [Oesophagostomum dentatum]
MVFEDDDEECSVCYQKMILPTVVPACGHRFCFLCIKGAASREGENTCPKCRGEVSPSIFKRPKATGVTLDMHDPESPSVDPAFARPTSSGEISLIHRVFILRPKTSNSDSDPIPLSKRVKPRNSQSQTPDQEEAEEVAKEDGDKDVPDQEPEPEPERFYWLYKVKTSKISPISGPFHAFTSQY